MKRLLVDCQVFHTPAVHRGMGKYSLELLAALKQLNQMSAQWDEIELLFSSKMPLEQEIEDLVTSYVAGAQVTKLRLKKDVIYSAQTVMQSNRKVIDAYVGKLVAQTPGVEIDFLILSPLQGGISSVFPSAGPVHKSLICYDLIPLMFHDIYFRNPIAQIENLTKLTELLKADTFFAISKTVANDLAVYLGVDPQRITSIDGGPIKHATKPTPYKVPRPFILMPTGNDLRKNNRNGVLGFSEFNKQHNNKYHLVVTSFFDPAQVAELSKLADNVVFTGNVSGGELDYLFSECEALLFPSEYEGLGLPVLEAVEKHKPVACSDIAVFREMSKRAFSYFDPAYGTSLAQALEKALTTSVDVKTYSSILDKYSWQTTAATMAQVLKDHQATPKITKPKIAVFGPNPQGNSAAAKLLQSAHAAVSRTAAVDYYLEDGNHDSNLRPNMLQFTPGAVDITQAQSVDLASYTELIYHITNTAQCVHTLFTALANPGVVILYDLQLDLVWQALAEEKLIDKSRLELEQTLHQQFEVSANTSLLCTLLANQKAVGVFGKAAQQAVKTLLDRLGLPAVAVVVLPYPVSSLVYTSTSPLKAGVVATFFATERNQSAQLLSEANLPLQKVVLYRPGEDPTVVADAKMHVVRTDREYEDALSRVDAIVISPEQHMPMALESAKYGTAPYYVKGDDSLTYEMPQTLTGVKDAAHLQLAVRHLLEGSHEVPSATEVMHELKLSYSYQAYVAALMRLIEAAKSGDVL